MKKIKVELEIPNENYNIEIFSDLNSFLKKICRLDIQKFVIVTDKNIKKIYKDLLEIEFKNVPIIEIEPGEKSKNIKVIDKIYQKFFKAKVSRKSIIVAFGGGVVGDIAGFASATYLRGIKLVQIPTTLLAMVDSSIGGKVGINAPFGKNLIGAFNNPVKVIVFPDFLKTLPDEQFQYGMAEVIKHGLIADSALLKISSRKDLTYSLIARAIKVKVNIITQDPLESGIRAYLNLGHTFAHAIEHSMNYEYPHGKAVSLGLLAAIRLSIKLNLCPKYLEKKIFKILTKISLPTFLPNLSTENCYKSMFSDKKWSNHTSTFVLLKDIGAPIIISDVPQKKIMEVLESLKVNKAQRR